MSIIRSIFISRANAAGGSGPAVFNNPIDQDDLFKLIAAILDFVVRIGTAVAVFMVIYSGFLFIKAQGDPEQIKTAKKTFLWTVIGGVILIGAKTLAVVIEKTAEGLGTGLTN